MRKEEEKQDLIVTCYIAGQGQGPMHATVLFRYPRLTFSFICVSAWLLLLPSTSCPSMFPPPPIFLFFLASGSAGRRLWLTCLRLARHSTLKWIRAGQPNWRTLYLVQCNITLIGAYYYYSWCSATSPLLVQCHITLIR